MCQKRTSNNWASTLWMLAAATMLLACTGTSARAASEAVELIANGDFETPDFSGGGVTGLDWAPWVKIDGLEIDGDDGTKGDEYVPGMVDADTGNQLVRIRTNRGLYQDIDYEWSPGDVFTLHLNAVNVWWRTDVVALVVTLLQQDGTVLWTSDTLDVSGTYPDPRSVGMPWAPEMTFDATIQASDFETGTPGEPLRLQIQCVSSICWVDNVSFSRLVPLEPASSPIPADRATDVLHDADLGWSPGLFAGTHNVYLGDTFEAVDTATVPQASGLDVNSFDPGRLTFGQTYYWRVDEVNATPDKTVYKGPVWSFEVEPYSIGIPVDPNLATASSSTGQSTPDMMVNGSGLDSGAHSEDGDTMWLSAQGDLDPWLMFEFDQVQKLDKMVVWNANSKSEAFIGWGIKDVNVETSMDGVTWTVLPETRQVSRGPGQAGYDTPDTIDLGLVSAKYVRLDILSNWGGILSQYSVSEVQFYGLPVRARTPNPAAGSVDVMPNITATWRAGREVNQHILYLSSDANAVADGSVKSVTTSTNAVALSDFSVTLGRTYTWRVDEVNDAETPAVWQGPVWRFTTVPYITVDDFESYGNLSPDRPFQTWLDGYGYSADDFFPTAYPGNGTGFGIGHDIWSPGSPYFDGSIMETARTMAGSSQSMPFYYSNSGGVASQIDRTFAVPQDWTAGGARILSIGVLGQADNTGTLYVKINNTKAVFTGDIALNIWQPWAVDLSTLGIDLTRVTTLSLGVDGAGASGLVLIDEIRLYQTPPEPSERVSLINDFDALSVGSSMDGVPGWEGWFGDAQLAGRITDTVAYSGTNSVELMGTRDDLVPHWARVDSGLYEATVMQYVPSSTDGSMYFGPLSAYGSSWDDTAWLGTLLCNCTTGYAYVNELDAGTRTETPLVRDQWVPLRIVMNFDADTCDFYYNDVLLGTLACPSAMGFDMWPDDDVDVIYFDDFSFKSLY